MNHLLQIKEPKNERYIFFQCAYWTLELARVKVLLLIYYRTNTNLYHVLTLLLFNLAFVKLILDVFSWYAYFFCLLHRPFHKIIDFRSMTEEELGEIWFLPSLLYSTHTKQSSIILPFLVLAYIIKTFKLSSSVLTYIGGNMIHTTRKTNYIT